MVAVKAKKKKNFGRVSEQSSVAIGGQRSGGQFKLQVTLLILTRPLSLSHKSVPRQRSSDTCHFVGR